MQKRQGLRWGWVGVAAVSALALAACSGGGSDAAADGDTIKLTLAHSYTEDQPQHACGAQIIADEVAAADVGLEIEIFPSSQLGGDADRIASVVSGDIDIDLQGASALGAVYEPISVLDAVYVFDGPEHLAAFMDGDASAEVKESFEAETGVHALGAWTVGSRQFTANTPIRTPEDLEGLRIRFPGSPQFLMNAKALGATATEVAYEELFLALQQGTVDGQENPITNIEAQGLAEVQDYLSLSSHQLNTNLIIMSSKWNDLNDEQQGALTDAVQTAVGEVTQCVADNEQATLDEWRTGGEWEVVEDVDIDAFRERALDYLSKELSGDSLAVFEAIRSSAS